MPSTNRRLIIFFIWVLSGISPAKLLLVNIYHILTVMLLEGVGILLILEHVQLFILLLQLLFSYLPLAFNCNLLIFLLFLDLFLLFDVFVMLFDLLLTIFKLIHHPLIFCPKLIYSYLLLTNLSTSFILFLTYFLNPLFVLLFDVL